LLNRIYSTLAPDGILLLEAQSYEAIKSQGNESRSWFTSEGGLFSDRPHICLKENFWDESHEVATKRYIVVDAKTGKATVLAQSMQAYQTDRYKSLLEECGFAEIEFYPLLGGVKDKCADDLVTIVARK